MPVRALSASCVPRTGWDTAQLILQQQEMGLRHMSDFQLKKVSALSATWRDLVTRSLGAAMSSAHLRGNEVKGHNQMLSLSNLRHKC